MPEMHWPDIDAYEPDDYKRPGWADQLEDEAEDMR